MNDHLDESRFGKRVCAALNTGTGWLGGKTAARLREARLQALDHQVQAAAALGLAGAGHGIVHLGHDVADLLHRHYRGILALLALIIGAMGAELWQNAQQAAELAEIDSALLSDEVPPGAYTDQGFLEWLEHFSSEEQENSLPE